MIGNAGSLNRFAYANGSPVSNIDPLGTMALNIEPLGTMAQGSDSEVAKFLEQISTVNDVSGLGIALVGDFAGETTFGLVGDSLRFYESGWAGGSAGNITTYGLEDAAKALGLLGIGAGVALDTANIYYHPSAGNVQSAVLNTVVGAAAFVLLFPEDIAVAGGYVALKQSAPSDGKTIWQVLKMGLAY